LPRQKPSLILFSLKSYSWPESNTPAKENSIVWQKVLNFGPYNNVLGEEAIRHARIYVLEAERKMGEMLRNTGRAQGKRTDLLTSCKEVDKLTIDELGITWRESAEAQMLVVTERAKGTDKGGRQYVDGNMPLPSNAQPTLSDLGISRQAVTYQKIFKLPSFFFLTRFKP
jgi:hypothetical protein